MKPNTLESANAMLHTIRTAFHFPSGPQPHHQTLHGIIAHISATLQALGTAEEKNIATVTGESLHEEEAASWRGRNAFAEIPRNVMQCFKH